MKPRPSSSPPPQPPLLRLKKIGGRTPSKAPRGPPFFQRSFSHFPLINSAVPRSIHPSVHPSPHERSDFFFGNQLAGSTHHAVPFDASRGQRSWIAPPALSNPNPPVSSLRIEGVSFRFPSFPNWRPGTRSFGVRRKRVDRFRAIAPESRLVRGER